MQTLSGYDCFGAQIDNPCRANGRPHRRGHRPVRQPMPMPSGSAVSWSLEPYGVGGTVLGNSSKFHPGDLHGSCQRCRRGYCGCGMRRVRGRLTIQVNQSPPPPPDRAGSRRSRLRRNRLAVDPVVSSSLAGYNITCPAPRYSHRPPATKSHRM